MSSEAVSRTTPATAGQHRGEVSARPPRRWRDKFADAFRGLKLGIRGQSSFFVHFFVAAAALAAAWVMALDWVSWCLLLLCIGMVLTAEMFNSALETFCRGLDEPSRNRCAPALDIAAGAVLLAASTAILVGGAIFLVRLATLLHWF
jgi:diacylglycerol kinase